MGENAVVTPATNSRSTKSSQFRQRPFPRQSDSHRGTACAREQRREGSPPSRQRSTSGFEAIRTGKAGQEIQVVSHLWFTLGGSLPFCRQLFTHSAARQQWANCHEDSGVLDIRRNHASAHVVDWDRTVDFRLGKNSLAAILNPPNRIPQPADNLRRALRTVGRQHTPRTLPSTGTSRSARRNRTSSASTPRPRPSNTASD